MVRKWEFTLNCMDLYGFNLKILSPPHHLVSNVALHVAVRRHLWAEETDEVMWATQAKLLCMFSPMQLRLDRGPVRSHTMLTANIFWVLSKARNSPL